QHTAQQGTYTAAFLHCILQYSLTPRAEQLAVPGHVQQRRAYEELKRDHGCHRVSRQGEDGHTPNHAEGRRAPRAYGDSPEAGLEAEGVETFAHIIEAAH